VIQAAGLRGCLRLAYSRSTVTLRAAARHTAGPESERMPRAVTWLASRLRLSPLIAKTHVSRIMTKLNARDRAQLVVLAYESGLVTPGQRDA
jgi:Bacterial regulatory proteins, luxR family